MKKYIRYICIGFIMIRTIALVAQQRTIAIQDTLQWQKNHKILVGKGELPVKMYSSKLVLLDFFTTSCTACIASFPFMNELQLKYKDKVDVIMITPESTRVAAKFFAKNTYVKANKLPVVVEDKWFSNSFPHKGVPHVVWIYENVVVAITGKDMVTFDNIDKILSGQGAANWPTKNDFAVDTTMSDDVLIKEDSYRSTFAPYKIGYELQYRTDTTAQKIAYHMINVDVIPALLYILGMDRKLPVIKKERVVLRVRDKDRFVNMNNIPKSFWLQKNAFCFSSEWPVSMESRKRHAALLKELSNRVGIRAVYEPHSANVWVIRSGHKKFKRVSEGDMDLGNWLTFVEVTNPKLPPLIIEGVPRDTKVFSSFEISDFKSLKNAMEKNGLVVEQAERQIDCLVIDDN